MSACRFHDQPMNRSPFNFDACTGHQLVSEMPTIDRRCACLALGLVAALPSASLALSTAANVSPVEFSFLTEGIYPKNFAAPLQAGLHAHTVALGEGPKLSPLPNSRAVTARPGLCFGFRLMLKNTKQPIGSIAIGGRADRGSNSVTGGARVKVASVSRSEEQLGDSCFVDLYFKLGQDARKQLGVWNLTAETSFGSVGRDFVLV